MQCVSASACLPDKESKAGKEPKGNARGAGSGVQMLSLADGPAVSPPCSASPELEDSN